MSRDAIEYRGALEAVERILNRGGDAEDVLQGVLEALGARGISFARVQLAGSDGLNAGLTVGEQREAVAVPVVYEGLEVGSLELATDDRAFAERVATLISHHVARLETGGAARRPAFYPSKATAQANPEGKCAALSSAERAGRPLPSSKRRAPQLLR